MTHVTVTDAVPASAANDAKFFEPFAAKNKQLRLALSQRMLIEYRTLLT